METTLQQFVQACKEHDWTYEMSDDGRYYRKGLAQFNALQHQIRLHPEFLPFYNTFWNSQWSKHVCHKRLPEASEEDFKQAGIEQYYPCKTKSC